MADKLTALELKALERLADGKWHRMTGNPHCYDLVRVGFAQAGTYKAPKWTGSRFRITDEGRKYIAAAHELEPAEPAPPVSSSAGDTLPADWQPGDDLTQWQWDDCMIWDMKTRIEDLAPSNIEIMWRKLQEYRRWIEREEQSALALQARLTAAEQKADALEAALNEVRDEPFWTAKHVRIYDYNRYGTLCFSTADTLEFPDIDVSRGLALARRKFTLRMYLEHDEAAEALAAAASAQEGQG